MISLPNTKKKILKVMVHKTKFNEQIRHSESQVSKSVLELISLSDF